MISLRQYRQIIRMHIRYARKDKRYDGGIYHQSIERIRAMWNGRND